MKTLYKFSLPILALVLLTSCEDYVQESAKKYSSQENSMAYFQDSRTGLCYSFITFDRSASHTNVPCTDRVMALIVNKPPEESTCKQ